MYERLAIYLPDAVQSVSDRLETYLVLVLFSIGQIRDLPGPVLSSAVYERLGTYLVLMLFVFK